MLAGGDGTEGGAHVEIDTARSNGGRVGWDSAILGGVLAIIPFGNACCLLMFPLGLWALIVLCQTDVRRAFGWSGVVLRHGKQMAPDRSDSKLDCHAAYRPVPPACKNGPALTNY